MNMPTTPPPKRPASLTPEGFNWQNVKAFAGFEVAQIFEAWANPELLPPATVDRMAMHGPPYQWPEESPREFGQRMAIALFDLVKHV